MNNEKKLPIRQLRPKIFCIGLNKTGTTSFGDAMRFFGYKRTGWNKQSPILMNALMKGEIHKLINVAYRHDVVEDIPWPLIYKELDETFPNAKFVLTVRKSTDKWLSSISKHIISDYEGHKYIYGHYHPRENEQAFKDVYEAHNREVAAHFAKRPGKLLTMCFENGDGWNKLLPFLGIEGNPKADWPHSNKAGTQPSHRNLESDSPPEENNN